MSNPSALKDKKRLLHTDFLVWLQRPLTATELIPVYLHNKDGDGDDFIFPALIPNARVSEALKDPTWDLLAGHGQPGTSMHYDAQGNKVVEYLRFGDDNGVEPLVHSHHFHGMREEYVEISEEFRHFHRLFHDRRENKFYSISDAGTEELIAHVQDTRVDIRVKELRQYLAVKDMHLALQFDCKVFATGAAKDFGLRVKQVRNAKKRLSYDFWFWDASSGGHRFGTTVSGKLLVAGLKKEQSGFGSYDQPDKKQFCKFIIGTTASGKPKRHTCDPDRIGQSLKRVHFLTPVHFRKEVLDKYYEKPSRYSIEDSLLRCGGLWCMPIDNHHTGRLITWLGDLGKCLEFEEQAHWLAHNIVPSGTVSDTFFRRQIMAELHVESKRLEDAFSSAYESLMSVSTERLGWPLLLPLHPGDSHYLSSIRIPASDEQKQFDELVGAMTKVIIDSLNESKLQPLLPPTEEAASHKGISKLQQVLKNCGARNYDAQIKFLRNLQGLRSSATAHRKGKNYAKMVEAFKLDEKRRSVVFAEILSQATGFMNYMRSEIQRSALRP